MKTPIESLDEYSDYLENGGHKTCEDGELLDLIINATKQEPNADGLPTDRCILVSIDNALCHHFTKQNEA